MIAWFCRSSWRKSESCRSCRCTTSSLSCLRSALVAQPPSPTARPSAHREALRRSGRQVLPPGPTARPRVIASPLRRTLPSFLHSGPRRLAGRHLELGAAVQRPRFLVRRAHERLLLTHARRLEPARIQAEADQEVLHRVRPAQPERQVVPARAPPAPVPPDPDATVRVRRQPATLPTGR